MKPPKHLLVTGIIRSGSTYVGNVLKGQKEYYYFEEPFNLRQGIQGVNHWFPYSSGRGDYYARLVDEFVFGHSKYRETSSEHRIKQFLKKPIGSRRGLSSLLYNLFYRRSRGMLIKDPLCALLSKYFYERHHAAVLVLVRHPLAFFHSFKRLGWHFNFDSIKTQDGLMDRFSENHRRLLLSRRMDAPFQAGLLWYTIYEVLNSFESELDDPSYWIVKRHENICENPIEEFENIISRVGNRLSLKTSKIIERFTNSSNPVKVHDNSIHVLKRDSRRLVNYWKGNVTSSEIKIVRSLCEELCAKYYEDSNWDQLEADSV